MSETLRSEKKDGRAARWTVDYARTMVEHWKSSGESAVAFAARAGHPRIATGVLVEAA